MNDEMITEPDDEPEPPKPEPNADVLEPRDALPAATEDSLSQAMRDVMARAGWTGLMPVQAKTIPYILAKRDLMVQSRTGSGKTGAFVMPILERIDPQRSECQCLVLVPTRELARQVTAEAELLAGEAGVRTVAVYGGVGYGPQLEAFRRGAHLVVGTPGRVLDHLLKKSLSLNGLQVLVFDEADRMLSMGFYPDMKQVQRYLPDRRVNGYMFSATFPSNVMGLASEFLHDPQMLSLSRDHVHVTDTEHVYYVVPPMEKDRCLVRIIEVENPASAIIFCSTKANVRYVTEVLRRFNYDADALSSDLSQEARDGVMARVRQGSLRFLVATDVAARGIDISELSHVIQYEPPEDLELYVHRAGRTGRAGASGVAVTLVAGIEEYQLRSIAKRFDIDMDHRPMPSDEDVEAIVSQRVVALLEARLRERDSLQLERMQRFVPLARSLGESDDELAVIAMFLDDYYQETLHAPAQGPPKPRAKRPHPRGESSEGRRSSRGRGDGRRRRR